MNWKAGDAVGSPDIVKGLAVALVKLTEEERLVSLHIQHDIEKPGGGAVQPGIEVGFWILREAIKENAQGLAGVEMRQDGLPSNDEGQIHLRREIGGVELAKEFVRGIVGETEISGVELLIKDRRTEEIGHLLLFDGITRES